MVVVRANHPELESTYARWALPLNIVVCLFIGIIIYNFFLSTINLGDILLYAFLAGVIITGIHAIIAQKVFVLWSWAFGKSAIVNGFILIFVGFAMGIAKYSGLWK
ncbi:hypothetical protein A3A14_00565 [Candidatus Daviesbacteria bacterium RIFCSPLOWO2_01_FULL_43_38]|uniref:Uncharacterized protein n=1 Tax=Candidatus Daviesbacteria bacterium RIFCSPHIGHO2_12_FULL_43_11 TaxID=1797780 RepID=A0A1F5K633_9BACT|nr:MAG: hypothetical protein A3E45_00800 [Candidatus Daviesbacteria bacterium RIFCSPHIGHO2_12_FULL_43_11]OGE63183.1 MAG: hypothetical protein A3A14_00565 [Candidatus Daviesbacteria bacterium RIFCSPLOWO2_01_FULL_43_38]